jgi:hypothetical protein
MGRRSTGQEAARARSRCRRGTSPTRCRTSAARGPNCAAGTSVPERPGSCGCPNAKCACPERSNNSRGNTPGAGGCACACSDPQECSSSEACTCVEFGPGCKTCPRGCASTACCAYSTECHRHDATAEGCSGRSGATPSSAVTAPCGSSVHRCRISPSPRCTTRSDGRRASGSTGRGTPRASSGSRCPCRSSARKDSSSEPPAADSRAGPYRQSSRCVGWLWASDVQG